MHIKTTPRRATLSLLAGIAGAVLLVGMAGTASAAIDPIGPRPLPAATWLENWLTDIRKIGGLTPELVAARDDYERAARVSAALDRGAIGSGVERWRPLVELHFEPGDVDWALRIIRCESGGHPFAKNPRSSASGLFQHLARLWPERAPQAGFGERTVFDPEANVAVAAWLLYEAGGKSHWTCRG